MGISGDVWLPDDWRRVSFRVSSSLDPNAFWQCILQLFSLRLRVDLVDRIAKHVAREC